MGTAPPQVELPRSVRHARWILAALVVVAAALRFIALDRAPPGINQDEAERAYEAWCLRTTGHDYSGEPWPVFFRAFGNIDYPPGTYIYALLPVQALGGVNTWSTRLPAAILGTLNVICVYLLVRRLYGERVGLLAAALVAISPWHVQLSRTAFEVSLCVPLVTCAMWLVVTGVTPAAEHQPATVPWGTVGRLGLAGAVFGLAAWTYNSYRVVAPLLLLGVIGLYFRPLLTFLRRPRGRLAVGAAILGLLIGLAPFIWASIRTPEAAWARAAALNIFHRSPSIWAALRSIAWGEVLHFNPAFLFWGTAELQSFRGYPQLHHIAILLLPIGLLRIVCRWRAERSGRFLLWWLLIGPLPAALTDFAFAHPPRGAGALPAYDIVMALGIDWMLTKAAALGPSLSRAARAVMSAALAVTAGYFMYFLFWVVPVTAAQENQAEWPAVIRDALQRAPQYDAVVLTRRDSNQLGMLYLFWGQIDPREYFAGPRHIITGQSWDTTARIGKFYFLQLKHLPSLARTLPPGARLLFAERPGVPVPGRELRRYTYPSGEVALILYELNVGQSQRGNRPPTTLDTPGES